MTDIIKRVFANYTVVAVTHSVESITGFDRVIALGNGQTIKEGAPHSFSREDTRVIN